MAEAIRIATGGSNNTFSHYRASHGIPIVEKADIRFTRDERVCETAAKAYEREVHSGELLKDHRRIAAVLLIRLGSRFLVEEARPRGGIWEVKFFDAQWNDLGFNYGAGA